jgi:hypothetical protein
VKKVILILIFAIALAVGLVAYFRKSGILLNGFHLPYKVAEKFDFQITPFTESLGPITQIKITSDGSKMFVSNIEGEIFYFKRCKESFNKDAMLVYTADTGVPGFLGREVGLTGMILSANFEESGDIFLLYSKNGDKELINMVEKISVIDKEDELIVVNNKVIYKGLSPTSESHQIQGGSSLIVEGRPYILFTIGDAMQPKLARDLSSDFGKLILMDKEGNYELLGRGIRNAYDTAVTDFMGEKFITIGDTGPSENDRFIFSPYSQDIIDFNWDGTTASLEEKVIVNQPEDGVSPEDRVLMRLSPTQTITNILFYDNAGENNISGYEEETKYAFVNIFGRTGSTDNNFSRKIMLVRIKEFSIESEDFIVRSEWGKGKQGHPLGLAEDPMTGDIYFGDIIEGKVFKVENNFK